MNGLWATYMRELRSYFFSPLAYAIAAFVLLINGVLFTIILSYLSDPRAQAGPPFEFFFNMSWLILLFVTPLLTMRLLADERRTGSIEVLMTAPVTEAQVVVGKYLAVLTYFAFLWLPTVLYAVIVSVYGDLDWGTVLAGYVGILGVGALALAIGVMASSFAKSQMVAAILAFALLVGFFFVAGWVSNLLDDSVLKTAVAHLDALGPQRDYARGIVSTRSLVFYLSTTVFFLFVASQTLATKKWR
jgi:ABC-2 type transport system permease protein